MLLSASTVRFLLLLGLFSMALLAAFYLRRRELTLMEYIAWGLLAVCVPLIGPFLVILNRPGRLKAEYKTAALPSSPPPAIQYLAKRLQAFEHIVFAIVTKIREE
jgi:hypothetical protein